MPPGLGARESLALVLLYQAGAHLEALTQALGRDVRTVQSPAAGGVPAAPGPTAPRGLAGGPPRETIAALDAYRTAVAQWHRTACNVHQQATQPAPGQFGFASPTADTALLHPPRSWSCPKTSARDWGWHSPACCWSMPGVAEGQAVNA